MSTISNTPAASTTSQNALSSQTLNQADFLKLLVTQMTSQDPLNPQSDTQFAAQLAQFSALQESQNMQQNMAEIQANSLIGLTVGVNTPTGGASSGVVSGVQVQSGTPDVLVNGQLYDLSQITSVSPPATNANTAAANSSN